MKIYQKITATLLLALLMAGKLAAQQSSYPQDKELIPSPFQLNFIHLLSKNRLDDSRAINSFSLNLLPGYAAKLERMELAGFTRLERGHVGSIQAAGFLNSSGGSVEGLQFSGPGCQNFFGLGYGLGPVFLLQIEQRKDRASVSSFIKKQSVPARKWH